MATNLWEALQPQIQQGLMEQMIQAQQPVNKWEMIGSALSAAGAGMLQAPRGAGIGYGAAAASEALKPYAERMKRGTKLSLPELAKMAEIAETFRPKKGNLPEVMQLQEVLADPATTPEAKAAAQARIEKLSYIDKPDEFREMTPEELKRYNLRAGWVNKRTGEPSKTLDIPQQATPAKQWREMTPEEMKKYPGYVAGWMPIGGGKPDLIKGAGETGGMTGFAKGEKPQRLQWLADKSYQIQNEGWESLSPKDRYNYSVLYGQEVEPVETVREGVLTTVRPPLPAGIMPPPDTPWAKEYEASRPPVPPPQGPTPVETGGLAGPPVSQPQYIPPQPESGQVKIDLTPKEKADVTNMNIMVKSLNNLEEMTKATSFTEKMNPFGTEAAGLMTAYKNVQNFVRGLHNSGVLNVGELPFIKDILNDPLDWRAALNPERISAQVTELKKLVNEKIAEYQASIQRRPGAAPAAGAPPPPAAPPSEMSLEELLGM